MAQVAATTADEVIGADGEDGVKAGDVAAVAAPEGAWTHEDTSYAAP